VTESPALDIALGYIKRGWSPIPLPDRSKKPPDGDTGWPLLRLDAKTAPQYFNGGLQNIGVLTGAASGGLVDIDLDDALAVRLAPAFLPATEAIFGRKGNSNSHYLYTVTDGAGPRITFKDSDEKMLVEYRGDGTQTVFPGSRHKDTGESVEWIKDGRPARILRAELLRAVGGLAAATLIAKRWHEKTRDELCSRVVGAMLRAGAPQEKVEEFITAIGQTVGDEELRDRVKKVRRCAAILKAGGNDARKVYGWPKLEEFTDRETVRLFRTWLGLAADIEPFPLSLIHSAAEFNALDIPPREPILEGLLLTRSLVEVFAKRGVGKTFFALSMGLAVARGAGKFLEWTVHKARRVLYIDGEMSGAELQERLRKFCGNNAPQNFDILASDTFYQMFETSMNLANAEQQQRFLAMLDALEARERLPEVRLRPSSPERASALDGPAYRPVRRCARCRSTSPPMNSPPPLWHAARWRTKKGSGQRPWKTRPRAGRLKPLRSDMRRWWKS
jgi:hypothetical protein